MNRLQTAATKKLLTSIFEVADQCRNGDKRQVESKAEVACQKPRAILHHQRHDRESAETAAVANRKQGYYAKEEAKKEGDNGWIKQSLARHQAGSGAGRPISVVPSRGVTRGKSI
jgi:hypothetical protein